MAEAFDSEEETSGGAPGWVVSFADLMTLLFAAFVVLYGITPQGKSEEIMGMISSIRESFVEIPDELPESLRASEMFQGKFQFQEARRDSTLNPAIKKFNRTQNEIRGRSKNQVDIAIVLKQIGGGEGIHESLRQATSYSRFEYGHSLELLGAAYFAKDSSRLTSAGQAAIAAITEGLRMTDQDIIIVGHADLRTSGTRSPLELSASRAETVRQQMIKAGLKQSRIRISAMGDLQPKSTTNPQLNNRIEINLIQEDAGGR